MSIELNSETIISFKRRGEDAAETSRGAKTTHCHHVPVGKVGCAWSEAGNNPHWGNRLHEHRSDSALLQSTQRPGDTLDSIKYSIAGRDSETEGQWVLNLS